jgi:hypothetical protein
MEESKFCTGCGKAVGPDMQFCPQCGKVVSGSLADEEFKEAQKEISVAMSYARRNWLIFLLGIYAIPIIIAAIIVLIEASSTASAIWSSTEFQDWLKTHSYNYTEADIKNAITYAAGMALGSGICAAVSLAMVYLRKHWAVAVAACILAAVLCFWSIFGMIIGFLVAWLIIGSRDLFEEPEPEPEPAAEQ